MNKIQRMYTTGINRWKRAFFILLAFFIMTTGGLIYSIVDQSVSLTYLSDSYSKTEDDLNILIAVSNIPKMSREHFEHEATKAGKMITIRQDTIFLNRLLLVFNKEGLLSKMKRQW